MCDHCAKHGHGRKWYLNAYNYSKKLAKGEQIKEFCESYFARDIKAGSRKNLTYGEEPTQAKINDVDQWYKRYLHHQVISFDEAMDILQLANRETEEHEKTVVLLPCICRYVTQGSDPGLHCFGIAFTYEYTKRFPDYLGGGHRYISGSEACELLEELVKNEDIVHAVSGLGIPYLGLLCNCDMKICQPYLRRLKYGITSPIYKAHYRAEVDDRKCTGCGICEEVCQFKVVKMNRKSNLPEIDRKECYGCGLCVRHCPEDAIKLTAVEETLDY